MNTSAPKALPKPTFIDLLLEKKQLLITVFIVIALAAGGAFFWIQKNRADEEKAAAKLARVIPWIETGNADQATKGLREIISNYGGTASGNMAKLYLAAILYTSDKPDDALKIYHEFSSPNKDLQASALAGAAACEVRKKAYAAAADGYQKASDAAENEALKAMYLNKAAENLISAGKPDEAVKLIDKMIKSWPATSSAAVGQRTLWRLSGQGVQVPLP